MSTVTSQTPTLDDRAPVVSAAACERCGAPVEPLDKFCPGCGAEQAAAAKVAESVPGQKHFRCRNCGAELSVDPNQRSYVCPFCDSTYVVEFSPEQTGRQAPEFVIGFAVTPEQAQARFRQWMGRKSFFRPGDLRTAQIEGKLKGVYLPFWAFSMLAESRWSAEIGEHWQRTETYTTTEDGKTVTKTRTVTETEWWDLGGGHHNYYSGYLVSGSRGLPQQEAERIKPFHLAALRRYEPYFLAGWLSEEYSIGRDGALKICQQEFFRREQEGCASHLPGDTHRGLRVDTRFSNAHSDLALLPVYLLSYRYGDRLYRFLMNGQTGKIAGGKPLSGWRIALSVAAGVIAVLLILLLMALLGRLH